MELFTKILPKYMVLFLGYNSRNKVIPYKNKDELKESCVNSRNVDNKLYTAHSGYINPMHWPTIHHNDMCTPDNVSEHITEVNTKPMGSTVV